MKITTIIPCYNAAPFLAQALESVRSQTRPVDEVIVVDDCSTDDSARIAKEQGARVLRTPVNSGHAAARNLGIREAQGELLAWLDADDYWEPHHLELVVALYERWPETGAAFSGMRLFGTWDHIWNDFPCDGEPRIVFNECFERTRVPACSVVTPRAAVLEIGGFDEGIRYAPDFDFWLRLSRKFPFISTSEVTSNYRWHEGQISSQKIRQTESQYRTRCKMIAHLRDCGEVMEANRLKARMLEMWDHDLHTMWKKRRFADLRVLLALEDAMPAATAISRRMKVRLWIPAPLLTPLLRARKLVSS